MKRILPLFILQVFIFCLAKGQSFTINELVNLAYLPSKNIDRFMHKNGFVLCSSKIDSVTKGASFIEKNNTTKNNAGQKRTIDIYLKDNSRYFNFRTSVLNEYLEGHKSLIKSGFIYDSLKNPEKEPSMLFQKGNISILATSGWHDGITEYNFKLKEKIYPSSVIYAEDLLQFDSHEFLASFFGVENVNKDMFFLSEKELKKCSVLFSGTERQAVFVWGDENDLNNLLYILVTNVLPTANSKKNYPLTRNNEWKFKNGIHAGMGIKDLLKINEVDFDIYGKKSELAFMVKPDGTGKIDFKKTAVMLSCNDCADEKIFNQTVVSALRVAKANIPMVVYDVIIYQ